MVASRTARQAKEEDRRKRKLSMSYGTSISYSGRSKCASSETDRRKELLSKLNFNSTRLRCEKERITVETECGCGAKEEAADDTRTPQGRRPNCSSGEIERCPVAVRTAHWAEEETVDEARHEKSIRSPSELTAG